MKAGKVIMICLRTVKNLFHWRIFATMVLKGLIFNYACCQVLVNNNLFKQEAAVLVDYR